jgi:hypothetical protein
MTASFSRMAAAPLKESFLSGRQLLPRRRMLPSGLGDGRWSGVLHTQSALYLAFESRPEQPKLA